MTNELDFKGLAKELLGRSRELVPMWLPGGKIFGREYKTSGLNGGSGDSMSVNLDTGLWADFADNSCSGGDLISLYAKIHNISQAESYRILIGEQGYEPAERPEAPPEPIAEPEPEACLPPEDVVDCDFIHPVFGEAIAHWTYRDEEGRTIFHVARYEKDGKKHVLPWSWSDEKGWILKGFPAPRPLYGLEHKTFRQDKKLCLIVEGEKAAEAARDLLGDKYLVVTWSNGAQAFNKADWSPIFGWCILLWPDRDLPGKKAMTAIAEMLKKHCPQIRMIDPGPEEDGWDAYDALYTDNFTQDKTIAWAKERVKVIWDARQKQIAPVAPKVELIKPVEDVEKSMTVDEFGETDAIPTDLSLAQEYWIQELGLQRQKNQQPLMNADNVYRALQSHPRFKGNIYYDTFYSNIFVKDKGEFRQWNNDDGIYIMMYMQRFIGLSKVSKEQATHAARMAAKHDLRNEPKDWLESLKWDGVQRLDSFLTKYYTVDESAYASAVGKNFWIGMVARIYKPGCKQDCMMILEGPQGNFKTTSLETIGGKWYSCATASPDNKDFFGNLRGYMLVEIKELDNFRKVDATLIKKILDTPYDDFRPPYAEVNERFFRQSVFVGTTNEKEYLKDNSGARRFYPVQTHTIDLAGIARDREQLFAEAVVRFKAGETWHEVPKDDAVDMQEDRRLSDAWEDVCSAYLDHKTEVSVTEICTEALKIDIARMDHLVQKRVGKILRFLKWEKFRLRGGDNDRRYVWRNPKYYEEPEF